MSMCLDNAAPCCASHCLRRPFPGGTGILLIIAYFPLTIELPPPCRHHGGSRRSLHANRVATSGPCTGHRNIAATWDSPSSLAELPSTRSWRGLGSSKPNNAQCPCNGCSDNVSAAALHTTTWRPPSAPFGHGVVDAHTRAGALTPPFNISWQHRWIWGSFL